MKNKIILNIFAFISTLGYSQVIIGDEQGTATDKTSVLLEFSQKENRGLILPAVRTLPTTANLAGTIVLDATDETNAQVKYYNGTEWVSLSQDSANISQFLTEQPTGVSESQGVATVIGAETSNADGVLVLESADKAMVLPTVSSYEDIVNPTPGMMVYISNDTQRLLAVFNGYKWSFWSATE